MFTQTELMVIFIEHDRHPTCIVWIKFIFDEIGNKENSGQDQKLYTRFVGVKRMRNQTLAVNCRMKQPDPQQRNNNNQIVQVEDWLHSFMLLHTKLRNTSSTKEYNIEKAEAATVPDYAQFGNNELKT